MARSAFNFDPDSVKKAHERHMARRRAAGLDVPEQEPDEPREVLFVLPSWLGVVGGWRWAPTIPGARPAPRRPEA